MVGGLADSPDGRVLDGWLTNQKFRNTMALPLARV